jgi:polysaccharide biosynthesis protein PslG
MIDIPEGSGTRRPERVFAIAAATLLGAALILLVVFGAGSTQAAHGHHQRLRVPQGFLGLIAGPTPFDARDAAKAARTGVRTMRIGLNWSSAQPRPGPFNWQVSDAMIARLAANRIAVLPTLGSSPSWAAGEGTTAPVANKIARSGWQAFVTAAVRRYRPGGTFWTPGSGGTSPFHDECNCDARPVPIQAWQIWNEPNLSHYFTPKPSPKHYATLVKLSRSAIDRADPKAKLVLAGLGCNASCESRGGGKPGDIEAISYLKRLYRARGIKQSFDVAAFHPYPDTIGEMRTRLSQFREVMKQGRDRRTPLWLTELGWGSDPPGLGINKGIKGQRRLLLRSTKLVLHKRKAWRLQREYWFFWRDPPKDDRLCSFCSSSGLLWNDRRPKPAYRVFRRYAHAQVG